MKYLGDVHVAILAGGLGTRLASVLPGQQKVIAKVKKRPFLEYILEQLDQAGFKNVVICTGYLGDQVIKAFGDKYKGLYLRYSKEQSPLGTAGAIVNALSYLKSENVLIINGDSFCECNLQSFYEFHLKKEANASIILTAVSDTSRYGKVYVDESDQIVGFEEKGKSREPGLINGGIYLINRSFIEEIPEGKAISIEKEVFPNWIGKGFYGYKGKHDFIDIGTPETYAQAELFFSRFKL